MLRKFYVSLYIIMTYTVGLSFRTSNILYQRVMLEDTNITKCILHKKWAGSRFEKRIFLFYPAVLL